MRGVKCPCGHAGRIPADVSVEAKLRCTRCGVVTKLADVLAPKRRRSGRPSAKAMKEQAAREVIARYGNNSLDDPIDDLWSGARVLPAPAGRGPQHPGISLSEKR